MSNLDGIPERALAWVEAGKQVALATVVKTWGSAPRPVGAQLVIDADMAFEGRWMSAPSGRPGGRSRAFAGRAR